MTRKKYEILDGDCPYLQEERERLEVWDRDNEEFDEDILNQRVKNLKKLRNILKEEFK
jgi:hypothetical protein